MRSRNLAIVAFSIAILMTGLGAGQATTPAIFGSGNVEFTNYAAGGQPYEGAAEPTVGIPWDTDSVFFHEGTTTWKAVFDGAGKATWTEVTPPNQAPSNLDPMLHTDPDTARTWAGGLHGACSVMYITDDDGENWNPAGNICSGTDFDHQSIGSGPLPGAEVGTPENPRAHAAYYCAQAGTISCARSIDGGETWSLFTQEQTQCGGFHGHIRVSRVTGTMALPVPDCDGDYGLLIMDTAEGPNALQSPTMTARTIPSTPEWTNGFDPSVQFSRESGWLYYGFAGEHGIGLALSKDDGRTWEPMTNANGTVANWTDVGDFHDPPIIAGTFADVQAGDDERVAFSFIGLEATGNPDLDAKLQTSDIYRCDNFGDTSQNAFGETTESPMKLNQSDMTWHYYVAMSYDGAQTWNVTRISDDPVQRGGVYDVVSGGPGNCRNLLDFNDMDIDSKGRVHIAYADGCYGNCTMEAKPNSDTEGYRASYEFLFRQTGGRGLFAAYDTERAPDGDLDGDGIPNADDSDIDGDGVENDQDADPYAAEPKRGIPSAGLVAAIASIGALAFIRRRLQ